MSAVQGGFIVLSLGLRTPAVLNWRKRRIMGKCTKDLCSTQRMGKGLESYSLVVQEVGSKLATNSPLPLTEVLTCRGYEGPDRGRNLILYTGRRVPSRLTGKDKRGQRKTETHRGINVETWDLTYCRGNVQNNGILFNACFILQD